MSNLVSGFGFGSIGVSLISCDVDAAGFGAGAPVANLLLPSFLCSSLCNSAAYASSFTLLLRSNLSAPCGLTLRHSSIRILQRSEWACALFVVFECVDTCASNSGPHSSMFCLVIYSLWIRAPSNGNGGIGIGFT